MHAHKYYHVICKSLFGKQELAGNRWNRIRNQAKILHDSESRQRELIAVAYLHQGLPGPRPWLIWPVPW